MSDDEQMVEHLLSEPITQAELLRLCEIAAQFLGADEVLRVLEAHAYRGTVH